MMDPVVGEVWVPLENGFPGIFHCMEGLFSLFISFEFGGHYEGDLSPSHYEGLPLCDNKPVRFFVCCGWGGEHGGYNERLDSSTFAARWQATYSGYVPAGSLFSFFQRLGMRWGRILVTSY
ncbi:hypothetical protein V8E52_002999 [Russula decolorans]